MPLNASQWATVISKAGDDLDQALKDVAAYDANVLYPPGLQGVSAFAVTPTAGQRNAVRNAAIALIDGVIASLTAARNAP
jgi:hypothetical protein